VSGGEPRDGDYYGAREASAEERAFHDQQSFASDSGHQGGDLPQERESRPPEAAPASERPEPPRTERTEASQAPLDLPPPPQPKPYVVWSSTPGSGSDQRRDE
jgi:hypothetical protein